MANYIITPANLRLFDGEGGGATGETQASSGSTHRGDSGEIEVRYGKQPAEPSQAEPSDAGSGNTVEAEAPTPTLEERRKAFRELVTGEYKDIYTEDTQRIINQRFTQTKALENQINRSQPIIDLLMQRYNINGDMAALQTAIENDTAYWSDAAEAAGMTPDAYRRHLHDQRELASFRAAQRADLEARATRQKVEAWAREAEMLKTQFPTIDFETEINDPRMQAMFRSGVPFEHAYKARHHEEILESAIRTTVQDAEKRIVDNVRAKGARPTENGTAKQSAFVVKDDPSKFTKADRAAIVRKAARGEQIIL